MGTPETDGMDVHLEDRIRRLLEPQGVTETTALVADHESSQIFGVKRNKKDGQLLQMAIPRTKVLKHVIGVSAYKQLVKKGEPLYLLKSCKDAIDSAERAGLPVHNGRRKARAPPGSENTSITFNCLVIGVSSRTGAVREAVAIFTQLLEMWLAQLQQNVDGQEEEADPSSPSAADPAGVNSSNILGGLHGPKTRGQRMRQQAQQSTAPDTLQQHVPTGSHVDDVPPGAAPARTRHKKQQQSKHLLDVLSAGDEGQSQQPSLSSAMLAAAPAEHAPGLAQVSRRTPPTLTPTSPAGSSDGGLLDLAGGVGPGREGLEMSAVGGLSALQEALQQQQQLGFDTTGYVPSDRTPATMTQTAPTGSNGGLLGVTGCKVPGLEGTLGSSSPPGTGFCSSFGTGGMDFLGLNHTPAGSAAADIPAAKAGRKLSALRFTSAPSAAATQQQQQHYQQQQVLSPVVQLGLDASSSVPGGSMPAPTQGLVQQLRRLSMEPAPSGTPSGTACLSPSGPPASAAAGLASGGTPPPSAGRSWQGGSGSGSGGVPRPTSLAGAVGTGTGPCVTLTPHGVEYSFPEGNVFERPLSPTQQPVRPVGGPLQPADVPAPSSSAAAAAGGGGGDEAAAGDTPWYRMLNPTGEFATPPGYKLTSASCGRSTPGGSPMSVERSPLGPVPVTPGRRGDTPAGVQGWSPMDTSTPQRPPLEDFQLFSPGGHLMTERMLLQIPMQSGARISRRKLVSPIKYGDSEYDEAAHASMAAKAPEAVAGVAGAQRT